MWVLKRATLLFNSFAAMLQNKLHVFAARFTIQSFFIGIFFFYNTVQPEICQNIKNMPRTYPRLREEQFVFQLLIS